MNCDQCAALTINGVFCHEHGCPNRNKVYEADEGRWLNESDVELFEDTD